MHLSILYKAKIKLNIYNMHVLWFILIIQGYFKIYLGILLNMLKIAQFKNNISEIINDF